ncbi:LacI family transcriptional regulator [Alteribacter natronophilus]|nr:LacI family transcriptional regulator [Alteribacter natronophilus]
MSPTIKDVAKMSGVSMSTVSRVLNSPASVTEEKRIKVEKAIKQLKYHPNALARGLIYKRTQSVGVLLPDVANAYVAEVIRGMEDASINHGSNLILCNTDRNKERMIKYLKLLREKQVDGLVYTSDPLTEEIFREFDELNIPVVLSSTQSLEYAYPSVKVDDEKAGYDGTSYLIDKGHKHVAMISGPTTDPIAGYPRYTGYKQAMKERLGVADVDDLTEFGNFQYDTGYDAMSRLYRKNKNITAVFAVSDEMALGVISFLSDQGLSVPGDISVLGFDNTRIARMSIPKLTTVGQPMYDIGYKSMEKLEALLQKKELSEVRTYLPHKIIERESVREI